MIRLLSLLFALVLLSPGCAAKSPEARAEKKASLATELLDEAEGKLRSGDIDGADEALRGARETLADPEMTYAPEQSLLDERLAQLTAALPVAREKKRQQELEDAVRERRASLGPVVQALKDAVEAANGAALSRASLPAIDAARGALTAKLSEDEKELRELANRDEGFAGYLKRANAEVERAGQERAKAEEKLKFLEGPARLWSEGEGEAKAAASEKDKKRKKARLANAKAKFQACADAGKSFDAAVLGGALFVEGRETTGEAVLASCKKGAKKR